MGSEPEGIINLKDVMTGQVPNIQAVVPSPYLPQAFLLYLQNITYFSLTNLLPLSEVFNSSVVFVGKPILNLLICLGV